MNSKYYKSVVYGTAYELFSSQISYLVDLKTVMDKSGKIYEYLLENVKKFAEVVSNLSNKEKCTSNDITTDESSHVMSLYFNQDLVPNTELENFSFNVLILGSYDDSDSFTITGLVKFDESQELFTSTNKIEELEVSLKINVESFFAGTEIVGDVYKFSTLTERKKDLFGDENYNYLNKSPKAKDTYLRYTSLISTMKIDNTNAITTDTSSHFISDAGNLNSFSTYCFSGVDVSEYDVVKISLFESDLVMLGLTVSGNLARFVIKSMTLKNSYGDQLVYSSGILRPFYGDIFAYQGCTLITRVADNGNFTYYIYDLDDFRITELAGYDNGVRIYPILDQWSLTGGDLQVLKEDDLFKKILAFSGENLNDSYIFEKLYCDWYKFRLTNHGNINEGNILYVSPIGVIQNPQLAYTKVTPINKRLFMFQAPVYRSRSLLSYIDSKYDKLDEDLVFLAGVNTGTNTVFDAGKNGDGMIINGLDYNTDISYRILMDGLRRNPLRIKHFPVAELVDTFRGMIFYKEEYEEGKYKMYLL